MELYEGIFDRLMDFNDFVNTSLINDYEEVLPITVIPIQNGSYKIFYTKQLLPV